MMIALIGGGLVAAASMLLYLASPHQQFGHPPLPARVLGWAGTVLLVIGTILLLRWAGPATAIFIAVTQAMTVWSTVPLLVAWCRRPAEDKR